MGKKGLSDVFAATIIILVSVILFAAVYINVINAVKKSSEQATLQYSSLSDNILDLRHFNAEKIMMGDYDAELRRDKTNYVSWGGRIDVPLLASRLEEANINTYGFLLWHSPDTDWEDLHIFLNYTENSQLDVYAYLVPPSEGCGNVLPYRCDFESWARELAKLSLKYRNLKGWIIDDFANNKFNNGFFSAEYVSKIMETTEKINPEFNFYPVVYYRHFSDYGSFSGYAGIIDGIVFPFYSSYPSCNLNSTIELEPQIEMFNSLYNSNSQFIQVIFPHNLSSKAGDFVSFSAKISEIGDSLTFSINNLVSYDQTGYHIAQALVNDRIIWESDIGNRTESRFSVQQFRKIDLSEYSKEDILSFRVFEKKKVYNFEVNSVFYVPKASWAVNSRGNFSYKIEDSVNNNLDLIIMIYSGKLCGESSPDYVHNANKIVLDMAAGKKAKGSMIYCLDKTNISLGSKYDKIKNLYSDYE